MRIEIKRLNGDLIFAHDCENNSPATTLKAALKAGYSL